MAIISLHGHEELRRRLGTAVAADSLGQSLLFHGPRGIGKQRLALWLAQLLLCEQPGSEPCGSCQSCRYTGELAHPDLHWYFPREREKDAELTIDEVRDLYRGEAAERGRAGGLYAAPGGMEGIFLYCVRAIVAAASVTPALGRRKVIIVGDAERMVPQAGKEDAANAFLKLLEEPPADTTIILTSSEPGALLPTVRSRVLAVRVAPLSREEVARFVADPLVAARLAKSLGDTDNPLEIAAGAPGRLLSATGWAEAMEQARALLSAARGGPVDRLRTAIALRATGARGGFSDSLDALNVLIHDRIRDAAGAGRTEEASRGSRAIDAVERAREMASGNTNPQLLGYSLMTELSEMVR